MPEPAQVRARGSVDYVLRTQQQAALMLSGMADGKANIILTITSVVLTVSVAHLGDGRFGRMALVGSAFALLALLLAVIAVLPARGAGGRDPRAVLGKRRSPLFFGRAAGMSPDAFWVMLSDVLAEDQRLYESIALDLHEQAEVLAHKYRYLRASYLVFLVGALAAALVGFLDLVVV